MPVCTIQTNLAARDLPSDFILQFSKVVAETLKKPEDRITVRLETNVKMCRAGTEEPCMSVEIWSIAVFDEQRNPTYSNAFLDFLKDTTGIPENRHVLLYHPIEAYAAGKRN